MTPVALSFLRPEALPLLLAAPIVLVGLALLDRLRARRLADVLGPRSGALAAERSLGARSIRRALAALATLFALVAAVGPTWGDDVAVESRGVDLVVCIDVSRSMLARDAEAGADVDRLSRARREARRLAEHARGDRLALVVFAGEARVRAPLTLDADTFAQIVDGAGGAGEPEAFAVGGGSDLGAALSLAAGLVAPSGRAAGAAVVVLSDGEDLAGRGVAAAAACRRRGVAVQCVGLGSALGAKIPLADGSGSAFLRDGAGQDVVTRRDDASLRAIAAAGGGTFVDAREVAEAALSVYDERILPSARAVARDDARRRRADRFQAPLLVAFLLALLETARTDRRRSASRPSAPRRAPAAGSVASSAAAGAVASVASVALLVALSAPLSGCSARGDGADRALAEAISALRRGDLDAAEARAAAAAKEGGARMAPTSDFVRGNVAYARSEALEAAASAPDADPATLERSMTLAEDALALWRRAAISRDDWPAARRNVERALLRLARLRDRQALVDRERRRVALLTPAAGADGNPKPTPDDGAPPPPPAHPRADDPTPASAEPTVADVDPSRVPGLLDVLTQKEKEKEAARRTRRAARAGGGEKDW